MRRALRVVPLSATHRTRRRLPAAGDTLVVLAHLTPQTVGLDSTGDTFYRKRIPKLVMRFSFDSRRQSPIESGPTTVIAMSYIPCELHTCQPWPPREDACRQTAKVQLCPQGARPDCRRSHSAKGASSYQPVGNAPGHERASCIRAEGPFYWLFEDCSEVL